MAPVHRGRRPRGADPPEPPRRRRPRDAGGERLTARLDRGRALGTLLVAAAASTWGTWKLFFAWGERHGEVPAIVWSVALFAGMSAVALPLALRAPARPDRRRADYAVIAALGLADAANVLLLFEAFRRTTVAIAVLTHYLAPVIVAAAAPLFLGERARARSLLAVPLALAGLTLLLEPWSARFGDRDLVGAALGAGSAVCYAAIVLLNKRAAARFSAAEITAYHAMVSATLLLPLLPRSLPPAPALVPIALGALGPGAIAGLVFVVGLRRIPASHASVLTLLEPLVAVLIGARVFAEPLSGLAGLGAALILAGALTVATERRPS